MAGPGADRDGGYETSARLDDGGSRFARRALSLVLMAVGLGVASAMISVPIQQPADGPDAALRTAGPRRTALPVAQVGPGAGPDGPIPIMAGGLRWFDPATGTLSGSPYEGVRGAPLQLFDGSVLCVCLERPWMQDGTRIEVALSRQRTASDQIRGADVVELSTEFRESSRRPPIDIELALAPDLATLFLSTLVRGADGYVGRVLAVEVSSGRVLSDVALPLGPGAGPPASSTIRISPEGRTVSVSVWSTPIGTDPADIRDLRTYRIPFANGRLGAVAEATSLGAQLLHGQDCGREGFLSEGVYGALCMDLVDQEVVAALRVVDASGARATIDLPAALTADRAFRLDALADARRGRVFIWSPERRTLVRYDAESGELARRTYDGEVAPGGARPGSGAGIDGDGRLRWSDLRGGFDGYERHTLIGSADGTRLYAIGSGAYRNGDPLPSPGILVIDAETLELIDTWAPVSYYGDIARTGDGRFVIALGVRGLTADGDTARWQDSLVVHDAATGEVVAIYGVIEGLFGWTPVLLNPVG